jgi:hypothetical protein
MATLQPARASRSAMALPMPRLPPVISATPPFLLFMSGKLWSLAVVFSSVML